MKLLIADDSLLIRKIVERSLPDFTVVGSVPDGEAALKIFAQTLPDLVTLDIAMPKMDGLTCLVEMLKIKPGAKILIISSQSDTATVEEAMAKGAAGMVIKPFSPQQLTEKVREILGR